jgi:membrane glycosyltransferase
MKPLSLDPAQRWITLRRWFFAIVSAATVFVIGRRMFFMMDTNGFNALKAAIFILFLTLLTPIAISFWTAFLGFVVRLRGGDSLEVTQTLKEPVAPDAAWPYTAVVIPVYNEDPARVFAGIKATYESLEKTGFLPSFVFFVLSDTTDPDTWIREEMAFVAFRQSVSDPSRIFYRNRPENVERKTGNIADFCEGWGDRYRYMIIFDADSIMTGTCLVDLVRLMERHPGAGIIQAPPLPVNRNTFFGRLRQFATHAYSSIFITGLNFWQGGAANYWGHNAIIRIRPFIEHCHLPKLPGKEPLGGSILSHDFVEAAFMRRAGWKVFLASELRGSYEEVPHSLISYAARDQRWCQGNMQHARLLLTPGLHRVSRLHMLLGVMAYLAAPLWLLTLALSTIEGIRETLWPHPYFPLHRTLYPIWKISVEQQAILLFLAVMGLLLVPKLFSLFIRLRNPEERASFGGAGKLTLSVLVESVMATLLAPVLAFLQTQFVVGILLGSNVKWDAQDRGESETTFREAIRRHWTSTLLGVVWLALLLAATPKLVWWFSPVIAGFLLAIPISVFSSRVSLGQWARKKRLLLTPEEVDPPPILVTLDRELDLAASRPFPDERSALELVLQDAEVRDVHFTMLRDDPPKDELRRHYLEGLALKFRHGGPEGLTKREKRDLLLDAESIRSLVAQTPAVSPPNPVLAR